MIPQIYQAPDGPGSGPNGAPGHNPAERDAINPVIFINLPGNQINN
jgi:hypothetical protein